MNDGIPESLMSFCVDLSLFTIYYTSLSRLRTIQNRTMMWSSLKRANLKFHHMLNDCVTVSLEAPSSFRGKQKQSDSCLRQKDGVISRLLGTLGGMAETKFPKSQVLPDVRDRLHNLITSKLKTMCNESFVTYLHLNSRWTREEI
jgi:hypothetical protein